MGRREDFMAGLAPLQDEAVPPLHRDIKQLFPTDEAFKKWEDSLWLGLFFARRLTGVLAERPRVEPKSPAGRIQSFLEVAQGEGAFFGPQSLLRDLPLAIRRTCCVRIDGKPYGTGFLVGADLVLTNWHVVRSILKPTEHAERISIALDYLHEAGVGEAPVIVGASKITRWRPARVELAPDAEPSEHPLDYAVIRLAAALPGDRGFFDLAATPDLATGSRVVIVGHPGGHPLAVSFSRSIGLHGLDNALAYYDADTLHGSSGSLVLLESQNELKAALLHAGGKTADENFGIHLKAIYKDLEGVVDSTPVAPPKPPPKLESFFAADDDARAGQLATLISVLPPEVKLDTNASVSQQIQSLEAQWDDRFAEALEIARAVAVPAKTSAVEAAVRDDAHPVRPAPHAVSLSWPKIVAMIGGAAVLAGIAVVVVPRLLENDKPPGTEKSCGLTKQSLSGPIENELRCDFVKTDQLVQCDLSTPEGSIHGQCEHRQPTGRWTSRVGNKLVWEIDFATGHWTVPTVFDGYPATANEEHDSHGNIRRSMLLPSGAKVEDVNDITNTTHISCGAVSLTTLKNVGFRLDDGTNVLEADVTKVSFRGRQVAANLVDEPALQRQQKNFKAEVEQCHSPKLVEPTCKAFTWAFGCAKPQKLCYQHIDTARTIDEKPCGTSGLPERADPNPTPIGSVGATIDRQCTTLTRCVTRLVIRPDTRPTDVLLFNPYVKTLQQRVTFPIERCKSAKWDPQPAKQGDKFVESAKCVCPNGSVTPSKAVATFTSDADMPSTEQLTARFKALSNLCPP
jgi:hypothetical protein